MIREGAGMHDSYDAAPAQSRRGGDKRDMDCMSGTRQEGRINSVLMAVKQVILLLFSRALRSLAAELLRTHDFRLHAVFSPRSASFRGFHAFLK